MAKGAASKEVVFAKLREVYPEAFMDDKVLRIPMIEDGEVLELKVTLTCAKDVIGGGAAGAPAVSPSGGYDFEAPAQNTAAMTEPTQAEKDNVSALLKALF